MPRTNLDAAAGLIGAIPISLALWLLILKLAGVA